MISVVFATETLYKWISVFTPKIPILLDEKTSCYKFYFFFENYSDNGITWDDRSIKVSKLQKNFINELGHW